MMSGERIIYAGTDKAKAEGRTPADVLDRIVEVSCGSCGIPVFAVEVTLNKTLAVAKRLNRPVSVLCMACTKKADLDGFTCVSLPDAEIESLMRRFQAEIN